MTFFSVALNRRSVYFCLAILLGIGGALLTIETMLRLASGAKKIAHQSQFSKRRPREIRIVALGESTTASFYEGGVDISWPGQLEQRLREDMQSAFPDSTITVFNLGLSASSTPYLLAHLRDNLTALDPDIVVAMMGVNDSFSIKMADHLLFQYSYLFRSIYWAAHFGSCGSCYDYQGELSLPEPDDSPQGPAADSITRALAKIPIHGRSGLMRLRQQFEDLARAYSSDKQSLLEYVYLKRLYFSQIAIMQKALGDLIAPEDLEPAMKESLFRARPFVLQSSHAYVGYCNLKSRLRKSCLPELLDAFHAGLPPRASLLTVALQHGGADNGDFRALLNGLGLELDAGAHRYLGMRENFRSLARLANSTPFKLFVMQYPTGSVDGVRRYFLDMPDDEAASFVSSFYWKNSAQYPELPLFKVRFIDNSNFNEAVLRSGSSEYFADLFALKTGLRFGHTTRKGSQLIAENAAAALHDDVAAILTRPKPPNP